MSSRDGSDAPIEPIAVAELELCDPARAATPIVADSRARWIRVLLRAATVPVGWVWIDRQGTPTTEESPALPLAEVARNLAQRALQSRLESVERFALPPISIVICTRNRPELLSECLEAVGSLEQKPESNGRRETLGEELAGSAVAADAEIVSAARALLEQVQKHGGLQQNVRQDVAGNRNIFSGTGDINIGGQPP